MQAEQSQGPTSRTHAGRRQANALRAATMDDLKAALHGGFADLRRRPLLSLCFGAVAALFGGALIAGLTVLDQIWLVVAAGVGFPLVGPFLAAGLYEMSRRYGAGESFRARDIFLVCFRQQRREFGWMSFVVLFIFWIWAYQVRLIFALTVHNIGYQSVDRLAETLLTTSGGLTFLAVGTIVGGVLATILFSVTVMAMPLLLDRDVDVVTAMIASVQTVLKSPAVMLGWGALVAALTFAGIAPLLLGLIVVFPLLGHATWRLYERLAVEAD